MLRYLWIVLALGGCTAREVGETAGGALVLTAQAAASVVPLLLLR